MQGEDIAETCMELQTRLNGNFEGVSEFQNVTKKLKENTENEKKGVRDTWGNRFEFLLAIIGFTVGIGSIWRFPILCARNGGGAFLIPFFFFMATCGGPLYYIEVCLGQFSGQSAGNAFQFCPLFRGNRHSYKIYHLLSLRFS